MNASHVRVTRAQRQDLAARRAVWAPPVERFELATGPTKADLSARRWATAYRVLGDVATVIAIALCVAFVVLVGFTVLATAFGFDGLTEAGSPARTTVEQR
jgi:hypothetical protein